MTARQREIYRQLGALFSELANLPAEEPIKAPEPERPREEREWLTKREFCDRFKVSPTTAWLWGKKGRVDTLTLGPRTVRYAGEVRA